MKKWGIPGSVHDGVDQNSSAANEIALLERLVWVRYQRHWWPALLYHSYSELQQHLYDRLDMVLKAQFAMAIMRHMQEKKDIKVARLLGRPILEVIEVEEDCYCEFYWQLPNVLPKACDVSRYGGNLELYYDFHRALDQVEEIIREVSQENFALMPQKDRMTWLQRAHYNVELPQDQRPGTPHAHGENEYARKSNKAPKHPKSLPPRPPSDPTAQSSSRDPLSSIPTAPRPPLTTPGAQPNESGMWGMMSYISQSFEDSVSNLINGGTQNIPKDDFITRDQYNLRPSGNDVSGYEMQMAKDSRQSRDKKSMRRGKRSNKPFSANQGLTNNGSFQQLSVHAHSATGSGRTAVAANLSPPGYNDKYAPFAESRDPEESQMASGNAEQAGMSTALVPHRPRTPVELIPGLEGDDIIPGLSDKVGNARDIWSNVWSQMMLSRDEIPNISIAEDDRDTVSVSSVRKAMQETSLLDDASTGSATKPADQVPSKTPEKVVPESNQDEGFCLFGCGPVCAEG